MTEPQGTGRRDVLQATGAAMLASLVAGGSAGAATVSNSAGLTDVDQIRNRIGQYSFFYDGHQLDRLADLFWPDATLKVNMLDELKGRPAIHAWYAGMVKSTLIRAVGGLHDENRIYHVLFNHIIDIDGEKASATADYFSLTVARNHATDSQPLPTASPAFNTCGRFRFSLTKRAGDWRYARLEIDIFAGEKVR